MCTGAAAQQKNCKQILDPPPLLFWFSSLSLSFHSFLTVSHAEQLQQGRILKKKKTKASKATKASKGASSSGKGGKGAATSQPPSEAPSGSPTKAPSGAPSKAPSVAPSGAPSVVPTIFDPCQAAVVSNCGGTSLVCNECCYDGVGGCCKDLEATSAVCDSFTAFFDAC